MGRRSLLGRSGLEQIAGLPAEVARALLEGRTQRERLTADIYIPAAHEPGLGRLEVALGTCVAALAVETKICDAVRAGLLDRAPGKALADLAQAEGIISADERRCLNDADQVRDEVIQGDAFETLGHTMHRGLAASDSR